MKETGNARKLIREREEDGGNGTPRESARERGSIFVYRGALAANRERVREKRRRRCRSVPRLRLGVFSFIPLFFFNVIIIIII